MTVPSAAMPRIRIQRRFSTRHVQIGKDDGQQAGALRDHAVGMLELHSADQFRNLVQDPNEVGQSGTESPASLLVTSAPAMIRRKVQQASTTAKPVKPAIVGCGDGFQSSAPWVSRSQSGRATLLRSRAGARSMRPALLQRRILSNETLLARRFEVWSTVLVSFGATVTFWSCSPSFSWTNARV